MSEYIENNNVNEEETDDLIEEFQALIQSVSKEIIDNTVMDDLKLLKQELASEMGNFNEFVNKINTLTSNMDNIMSQTTQNMSSVIKTKTADLDNMLNNANETMNSTFASISSEMNALIGNTTDTMDGKFSVITSDINTLLNETTESINKLIDTTNHNVNELINTSTSDITGAASSITSNMQEILNTNTDKMNTVLENSTVKMSSALSETVDKIDAVINSTTDTFSEEIKDVKQFLSESEKLIKSNQTLISNVQNNIETKLEDALRHIELGAAGTRDDLAKVIATINQQVESMSKENKGLVELHNIINIKVDNGLSKMKTSISKINECIKLLEEDSKAAKRYKTTMIFNSVTLFSVLLSFFILLLRG